MSKSDIGRLIAEALVLAGGDDWPGRPPLTLMRPGERIKVRYTNWRGETAVRHLELDGVVFWGKTPLHLEPQWLISASDLDRPGESRVFALKDMEPVQ